MLRVLRCASRASLLSRAHRERCCAALAMPRGTRRAAPAEVADKAPETKRRRKKDPEQEPVAGGEGSAGDGEERAAAASQPQQQKGTKCWYLVKSEPTEVSVEDLCAKPNMTEPWNGVRNAQARNLLKQMKLGDQILFYYSGCKDPGIVAVCEVVREAYPDHTAWDTNSEFYDASSTEEKPKWFMVDLQFKRRLKRFISLKELKSRKENLGIQDMPLFNRPRLSVQPVTQDQMEVLLRLEEEEEGGDGK